MKRWLAVLLVLSMLLLVILPACGGGDGEENTITPIITPTAAPTVTPTVTPVPSGPVKIGVISPWSGPMAVSGGLADQIIAVVEQQVKDMGGILGGRQVEFIRGDDRAIVAEAVGQARKLALEENVDVLCFGGASSASFQAVAQAAEELKIPYIAPSTIFGQATMKYNISIYTSTVNIGRLADFPIEFIKPKTIAWLAYDDEGTRKLLDGSEGVVGARERWKEHGIDLIYEQYFPMEAIDLSPYLTTIKYKKPDLVITHCNNAGQVITLNKQIMDLGGWGDMKVFQNASTGTTQKAVTMPAALGNYIATEYIPGSDDPGMKAFEDAFKQKYNRLPTADLAYYYNNFWTAIKAIQLAGTTDRDKVAQAMRSGNLEWDSAWGHLRIPPDGKGAPTMWVCQIQEGGKLVKVWSFSGE